MENLINSIFTIGYEGKKINQFISELKERGIEVLIDARAKRGGFKWEFNKNKLKQHLSDNNIKYYYHKGLGTPSHMMKEMKESGHYSLEEYSDYLDDNFEPLYEVLFDVHSEKVAIMCFEKNAEDCHRSIVAKQLAQLTSAKVEHI